MITGEKLIETLTQAGVPDRAIRIFDSSFVMPSPEWITSGLGSSLTNFYFGSGVGYVNDQFDCNKFAKAASTVADWSWARTERKECALAFGVFIYGNFFSSHAINIAIHRGQDESLYLAFYEPQPSYPEGKFSFDKICLRPVTLDSSDIQSCSCCLFL